ncbi:MAG: transglycosylase domain-containing protein [Acidobacteriota bacterium]|jgi:penicillin-binding protein 1B
MIRHPLCSAALAVLALVPSIAPAPAGAQDLATELGRNEVRVLSAPYRIEPGRTVAGSDLPERLERLGYRRVHRRPEVAGEYFWGHDVFWVYRRAHRVAEQRWPARLFALDLDRESGRIVGFLDAAGGPLWEDGRGQPWIEPELLAESLSGDRAPRRPVALAALPEHVWRTVLAAEDHRFFDHAGVDAIAVARALLANALAGAVTQGGSTITQQLVKVRDLSPRRTLGRKVSEAVRALALEAEYDKREILESYLNHVYFGHVGGLAVHGVGAAARAYFSKPASELDLGEAALLAAVIQGPNRLSPIRHGDRVLERQRWVLARMAELGWAGREAVERERRRGLPRLRVDPPAPPPARRFLSWVASVAGEAAPRRMARARSGEGARGMVVQTGIDPLIQERAERAVRAGLERLEREHRRLRDKPLTAALVALDPATGAVLAHVGGDPRDREDAFDRARQAERQTGSALKPLVLLEAFDDCGPRAPLYPARRILDGPVTVDLPSGPWRPANLGRRYRGVVDLRAALVASLNAPFVRVARWCGFSAVAETMRRAGLDVPEEPPPSFVLGALGTTPAELAGAYTAIAASGVARRAVPVLSLHRPSGARIAAFGGGGERVAGPAAAFMVRDLMRDVVRRGTGRAADAAGLDAWGKTGSSSEWRDAWFVGGARSMVAALWVGLDDGSPLGLSSGRAAVPIWRDFMVAAASSRSPLRESPPEDVVVLWVQDRTGRIVDRPRRDSHSELFDRNHLPAGRRWWRPDPPLPVIE